MFLLSYLKFPLHITLPTAYNTKLERYDSETENKCILATYLNHYDKRLKLIIQGITVYTEITSSSMRNPQYRCLIHLFIVCGKYCAI